MREVPWPYVEDVVTRKNLVKSRKSPKNYRSVVLVFAHREREVKLESVKPLAMLTRSVLESTSHFWKLTFLFKQEASEADLKALQDRLNKDKKGLAGFMNDPVKFLQCEGITLPPQAAKELKTVASQAQKKIGSWRKSTCRVAVD
jgi:hypothetical protein